MNGFSNQPQPTLLLKPLSLTSSSLQWWTLVGRSVALVPIQTTPKLSGLKQTLIICYFIIFQTSMIGWMFPYIDSPMCLESNGRVNWGPMILEGPQLYVGDWMAVGQAMRWWATCLSLAGWLGLVQTVVTENWRKWAKPRFTAGIGPPPHSTSWSRSQASPDAVGRKQIQPREERRTLTGTVRKGWLLSASLAEPHMCSAFSSFLCPKNRQFVFPVGHRLQVSLGCLFLWLFWPLAISRMFLSERKMAQFCPHELWQQRKPQTRWKDNPQNGRK